MKKHIVLSLSLLVSHAAYSMDAPEPTICLPPSDPVKSAILEKLLPALNEAPTLLEEQAQTNRHLKNAEKAYEPSKTALSNEKKAVYLAILEARKKHLEATLPALNSYITLFQESQNTQDRGFNERLGAELQKKDIPVNALKYQSMMRTKSLENLKELTTAISQAPEGTAIDKEFINSVYSSGDSSRHFVTLQ